MRLTWIVFLFCVLFINQLTFFTKHSRQMSTDSNRCAKLDNLCFFVHLNVVVRHDNYVICPSLTAKGRPAALMAA